MNPGDVILLNGTLSSGKSTLARALQEIMEQTYFHLDLDLFQKTWPSGFLVYSDGIDPSSANGLMAVFRNDTLVEVRIGLAGFRHMDGLFRAVAGLASAGNHVIVDGVIYHPQMLRSAVQALKDLPVLFVGVRCPLEVAEHWEAARGNRARGGARTFYHLVHAYGIYDLEVDTSLAPPLDCARMIKSAVDNHDPRTAFHRLEQILQKD